MDPFLPPPVRFAPFLLDDPRNTNAKPTITPMLYSESTRKIAQVQMDLKDTFSICNVLKKQLTHQLQGDTGANCGATNDITLLWDYRRLTTPIPITTYDGSENSRCLATGVGVLKIISNDNTTMSWMMLHTPGTTGTILSPDRYMMDNIDVYSFHHHGNKSGSGAISFQNRKGKDVATITMNRRRDGLWFTENYVLIPPKPSIHNARSTTPICSFIGDDTNPPPPLYRQHISKMNTTTPQAPLFTALKHLELWHQRMGHSSLRTLRHTQRVIDGISYLPEVEAIFSCPFCDKAKLRKHHGSAPSTRETFLPGTSFHMDIGFIRGPKNLKEVLTAGAMPKETVIASHDGYTCYLLIINAATRYVWTFLLKQRSAPIALLKQFLTKHGYPKQAATITTSPDGLLAKSQSFNKVCIDEGFTVKQANVTIDWEAIDVVQPHCTIRTDNEYAASDTFRQAVGNEDFILETTAPDTSHQNGMGERPHRTLKERVRCLLYCAAFGIEFWSDGLLHSVWLYNRTFH